MPNYSGVWNLVSQMQSLKSGTWQTSLSGDIGLYMGHHTGSTAARSQIEYVTITSTGNMTDYVDLTDGYRNSAGFGSSTRAGIAGGRKYNSDSAAIANNIEFITIATGGDASDFGDLSAVKENLAASSNGTRAVFSAGSTPTVLNVMEFITIASAGDVTDFGDMSREHQWHAACSGTTRGILSGGKVQGSAANHTEYITIGSAGNATDFGDLSAAAFLSAANNSSVRACIQHGQESTSSNKVDIIDYFTIASTGDATDFGNLTVARTQMCSTGNATRGITIAGTAVDPTGLCNIIDYITFGSTGNATDFGDTTVAETREGAAASNCHGGLS